MSFHAVIGVALKTSITLTVFGFGLEATRQDLLYLLRRPRTLALSFTAMFVVMPLFALLIAKTISLNPAVVIALIVLSISPVPPLLPKRVTKSGGTVSFGLGLMASAAAFSIVYIPVAVYLLGRYFHKPFSMGPTAVAKLIVVTVMIPLVLGMAFRRAAPTTAKRIANPIIRIAGIVLLVGALCILAFALPTVWSLIGNGTIFAFIAFVAVGIAVGHLLGGPSPDERVTLALSTSCRHPALALATATTNIPAEHRVVSAILLYLVISILLTISYVAWQRKNETVKR